MNINGYWEGKVLDITREIKEKKIDIVAIQETKLTKEQIKWVEVEGYAIYGNGMTKQPKENRKRGTITLVRNGINTQLQQIQINRSKVLEGRLTITQHPFAKENYMIYNIYAPADSKEERTKYYQALNRLINKNKKEYPQYRIIILGDTNAATYPIDKLGKVHRGKNTEYCKFEKKWIDTYRYMHPNKQKCTLYHRQNKTRKEMGNQPIKARLDRILVDKKIIKKVTWANINKIKHIDTDHKRMSIINLRINFIENKIKIVERRGLVQRSLSV